MKNSKKLYSSNIRGQINISSNPKGLSGNYKTGYKYNVVITCSNNSILKLNKIKLLCRKSIIGETKSKIIKILKMIFNNYKPISIDLCKTISNKKNRTIISHAKTILEFNIFLLKFQETSIFKTLSITSKNNI